MRKGDRQDLMLGLLLFAAWNAWKAREAAEQATILMVDSQAFDPTSFEDWKKAVRDVTVTKVIERAGKMIIRRIAP
jgi:hypothetical protein